MKTTLQALTTAALLLPALSAPASVELYFADDLSPWPYMNPNQVPRQAYPNSQAMHALFLSRINGALTESFEECPTWSCPTNLMFGTGTNVAALFWSTNGSAGDTNASAIISLSDPTNTIAGTFPITGTNFLCFDWNCVYGSNDYCQITFSTPQAAFGFYATDLEFNTLSLTFARADGSTTNVVVPFPVYQGSGAVFYQGVIDRANPFTSVTITNVGWGNLADGIAFDDLTIGAQNAIISAAPAELQIVEDSQLQIQGTVGAIYRIDFSNVLPATNWVTIVPNFVLTASPYSPTNVIVTSSPEGFYRAIGIQ